VSVTPGTLTVAPAVLDLVIAPFSKTSGDTQSLNITSAFTVDGLQNDETITSLLIITDGADPTAPVNTYPVTLNLSGATGGNGFDASNYWAPYFEAPLLTVNPAILTITANSHLGASGKTYGDDFPI